MHIIYLGCTVLSIFTVKVCYDEVLPVCSMLASVSELKVPGYLSQTFSLVAAT